LKHKKEDEKQALRDSAISIAKPHGEALDALNTFISTLMESYSLSYQDVIYLLNKKRIEGEIQAVPVEIFRDRKLGILEILAKYLKEEKNFRYTDIAKILSRDERTIWVSYKNAVQKKKSRFVVPETKYWVPLSIFANRKLGLLQVLVVYFKEKFGLSNHAIAVLLNRDSRTIWSVYNKLK
jgi:hypothetical protein